MRPFLAAFLLLLLAGCGDKAKDLYDTAKLEEKQNNRPHATKIYRQIVEEYPNSPYANQARTRLVGLGKRVSYSSRKIVVELNSKVPVGDEEQRARKSRSKKSDP
jgi:outer membrane protein assembly factor BamD (BamD/ComL family)